MRAAQSPVKNNMQHPNNIALNQLDLSKLIVDMQPPINTNASPMSIARFSSSSSKVPPTIKTATRRKPDTVICFVISFKLTKVHNQTHLQIIKPMHTKT